MVKLKGGNKSSDEPEISGELVHLEAEFLAQQEATSARLDLMQASLRTELRAELRTERTELRNELRTDMAAFRVSLLEELKSSLVSLVGSSAASRPSVPSLPEGTVKFGSVSSPILTQRATSPHEGSASSTHARSEGPPLLQLDSGGNSSARTYPKSNPGVNMSFVGLDGMNMCVDTPASVNNDMLGVQKDKMHMGGVNVAGSMGFVQGNSTGWLHDGGQSVLGAAVAVGYPNSNLNPSCLVQAHTMVPSNQNPFSQSYSGPCQAETTIFTPSKPSLSTYTAPMFSTTTQPPGQVFVKSTNATTTTTQPLPASYPSFSNTYTSVGPQTQAYQLSGNPAMPHYHTTSHNQPLPSYQWSGASPHPNPQSTNSQQPFPNQWGLDPSLPTMKQMKLDFAMFQGGDPTDWLNKAEQYFDFYQIPEDRKLAVATMHLADKASDRWFTFKHEFPATFQGLSDLLMREFSCYNRRVYQAALARLNQTGKVEQYMEEFTKLVRRTSGFSLDTLVSFFIEGLREDIRGDVQALKPKSLYEACELARIYEGRNEAKGNFARKNAVSSAPAVYSD
ncbi:hypothetical protein ACLB2K_032051 [Fragaria x ananassa]